MLRRSREKVGAIYKFSMFWRTLKFFRNLFVHNCKHVNDRKDRCATAQVNVGRPKKTVKYTVDDAVKLLSVSFLSPVKIAIVNCKMA